MENSLLIDVYVQHLICRNACDFGNLWYFFYLHYCHNSLCRVYFSLVFIVSSTYWNVFFLYTLFYATFGSVVRLFTLLILITIADVTNLFSAAQFVFYGYTLCQIINTMYFFAFMRDLVCDALHNIMEVVSAGQFKGNAIFLWLNGNFKNRKKMALILWYFQPSKKLRNVSLT